MKMIDLLEVIQDEKRSEDFLRSRGILKTFTHCYKCNSTKLGMTRADRWKCYSCESEWTRRKDSILALVRIKYSEFLLCMKFFELELTAEDTATQLKLNYKTVRMLFIEFRIILTSFDLGKLLEDNVLVRDEEVVFLLEDDGKIFLAFEKDKINFLATIKLERHFIQEDSTYYDFEISEINNLLSLKISKKSLTLHRFIRYSKKRLFDFKGTGRKNLLARLKEIEYRFNNQRVDLFDCLGELLSRNF